MVPPSSVKVSRAPTYSISHDQTFDYGAITRYGRASQRIRLISHMLKGWSPFARRYWGISVDFFSSGYLDVSVPLVRLLAL